MISHLVNSQHLAHHDLNLMRPNFASVIEELSLLTVLHKFTPRVIGTPPLGIDIATSDIDIACSTDDLARFQCVTTDRFGECDRFQFRQINIQNHKTFIAQFHAHDWDIELFCQSVPTDRQWGVRHFIVEQRLIAIDPNLKFAILVLKQQGMKTEPAFANVLNLIGDPYQAMLKLENMDDDDLKQLLDKR